MKTVYLCIDHASMRVQRIFTTKKWAKAYFKRMIFKQGNNKKCYFYAYVYRNKKAVKEDDLSAVIEQHPVFMNKRR